MKKTKLGTRSIQSLDRGLAILEAVAESPDPVPLGQLTALLGIDRSSVFRLAITLKRRGYLTNPDGEKDYVLGPSIWRLSRRYDWTRMLASFCHEHLRSLARETGETAHLVVREGQRTLFIDHASTNQVVAVSSQTGELMPLYCTAHGKALLADFTASELKALFGSTPLQAYTKRTIVSIDELAKACAAVRKQGYAIDNAEFLEDVRCMAAPIRDKDGSIVAAVGISAPLTRFPPECDAPRARQVCGAAKKINAILNV